MGIASRASWGARHRNGVGSRPVGRLGKILHHTASKHLSPDAGVEAERAQMRLIESIGQQRFGGGISYNIGIVPSARIYEGASIDRIAYHSGSPRNVTAAGIVLVGNYDENEVTDEVIESLAWTLRHGVERGWWDDPFLDERHNDFRATSCPGRFGDRAFDAVNRLLRADRSPVAPPKATGAGGSGKTVAAMAAEVIAGKHGTGHSNRRRSLGVSERVYEQVRAEVNRRAGSGGGSSKPSAPSRPAPKAKSVSVMADEVIAGQHGTGHATRRRSLGVSASTYAAVRAEVNRRAGVKSSSRPRKSVNAMADEVIRGDHGTGHEARRRSLGIDRETYQAVRAAVNRRF